MDQVSDRPPRRTINTVGSAFIKCVCISFPPAEKGQFLALDLGGSKFKVLQVKVREGMGIMKGGVEMEEKTYPIPKGLLTGRGAEVGRSEQDLRSGLVEMLTSHLLVSPCSCLTTWQSL